MAMDAVNNHNELKRKEHVLEVIEISSDSEPEIWPSKVRQITYLCPGYALHLRGKKWTGMLDHPTI